MYRLTQVAFFSESLIQLQPGITVEAVTLGPLLSKPAKIKKIATKKITKF